MAARIAHHRSRTLLVLVLSLVMSACYSHDPAMRMVPGRIGVGDVVTREELVASGASSLYDALMRTRGNFFSARGGRACQAGEPRAGLEATRLFAARPQA